MIQQQDGLIVRDQSGFYWVKTEKGEVYRCQLRGKLKAEAKASDIAAIGDRVTFTPNHSEDGVDVQTGVIDDIHERHAVLSRAVRTSGKRGSGQAEREHVLIANLDQAFFVFAALSPTPDLRLLDRLLVTVERAELDDIVIVINKIDLGLPDNWDDIIAPYEDMGYDIIYTSAVLGNGIDELRALLDHRISVFTGPSGVGKSSLLNAIRPDLGRTVKSISEFSQEGVHTTRDSALVEVGNHGYLADTPGIRSMSVWDVEPDELEAYFSDIADYAPHCKFRNCSHTSEPGCAVRAAVDDNRINRRRYEHFLQLRDELRDTYIVY